MSECKTQYNKSNPFLAKISERYMLCKPGSEKTTCHVVLDIHGSDISYQVGDSIAIQPINDHLLVKQTLNALKASGDEEVFDKQKEITTLKNFLTKKANLNDVPRKLILHISANITNPEKKEHLQFILSEGQQDLLKEYQNRHEVWDFIQENMEGQIDLADFCNMLQPLLPRFYSISSSMLEVGNKVHLTVADFHYVTNGHLRRGVCTNFLCNAAPMHEANIPIYVQPGNGFTLPESPDVPIIMIGPGTGVAPFRAFLQERIAKKATGPNWLFFGEWHKATEFFYQDYFEELVLSGHLKLDTAFSRDQPHKVYVQHKMIEHGKDLYKWIKQGGFIFVCGDARRMAKDVEAALLHIIQIHAELDEKGAKELIKSLRAEKRYLRDVY